MEDKRNTHLKVQELADCYATNDPLKEMSEIAGEEDKDEAALKWIALAALHAVNSEAKKISLEIDPSGAVTVEAKYRETTLPSPGPEVGPRIVQAVRDMLAVEGAKAKGLLALGIRNDNLEVKVKVKRDDGEEELSLSFGK